MIFVLGVFLVSWRTQGYIFGIVSSLISVLAVNWAFTYPYWEFDLISPECISSAVVMLIVAIMTGTLRTQIKQQEKVKAEAERERMRGNLLRAVSHDLRTPLTSIYGACSTLRDNYDALSREKHLKLLSDVCGDAQWLTRMVENLLSITRIDGGNVRLNKQDTVLEELIDAVMLKFHKHYPEQPVHVRIPEVFVSIPMDAMLIQQVLINLLENAVFHAEGMQNLWLTVTTQAGTARFSVADDGKGIAPERMAALFSGNQYSGMKADSGRSNMGIGLSVCAAIVRAHDGTIAAHNRPEGGAEFSFTLKMEEDTYGE
jgi:two-component system sensor histidine kinase KdpD